MKILRCIICNGEVDILNEEDNSSIAFNKKIKCKKCGFTNSGIKDKKEPEIIIIKRQY